ncbi:MAG: metal ABC transporter permease [Gammaproteobacteria bacterium]|nr:metal ABC transporter permease [Gammaproteobacteria bacterium]
MSPDTSLALILPAFLAGALVLASHVPMGQVVLARGIVFLDLAVAQIATLGLIMAPLLGLDESGWPGRLLVFAVAIGGALLLSLSDRRWPEVQEAVIGSSFVVTASLLLVLLSQNPHGGERLVDMLAGQILWVGYADLVPLALLTTGVLMLWWRLPGWRSGPGFYLLFAIMITSSVQLVGVYLVFSSLILPALVTRRLGRRRTLWGWSYGMSATLVGLLLSLYWDLPAGAAIVLCMALLLPIWSLAFRRFALST